MSEPFWLDFDTLIKLHDVGLAEYGGPSGVRDLGLLSSALQRPQNLWAYEGVQAIPVLAATYAVAIAKNHPFIDGNKRAAFLAMVLFLRRHGLNLNATDDDAISWMLGVASGRGDLQSAQTWVSSRAVRWRG